MIDLYYSATPNGQKILLFLEEAAVPYRLIPISLSKGEQFAADFLRISPNNKIPAIIDRLPVRGAEPVSVFESGAILLYLAEKTGQFLPQDAAGRLDVLQWLFWQVGGLGPMAGQAGHFRSFAPETIDYAIERYTREVQRLYEVLNSRLSDREFIADVYSIADIACYPWVVPHVSHGQNLAAFPHLRRWVEAIARRPATVRVYQGVGDPYASAAPMTSSAREILFGHGRGATKS